MTTVSSKWKDICKCIMWGVGCGVWGEGEGESICRYGL